MSGLVILIEAIDDDIARIAAMEMGRALADLAGAVADLFSIVAGLVDALDDDDEW